MNTLHNRGNSELLECVVIARAIEAGEHPWLAGCAEIARRIVAGRVDPNDACSLLAEVAESLKHPAELSSFVILAHEQRDHEALGFTAASCAVEIVDEARRLVALANESLV